MEGRFTCSTLLMTASLILLLMLSTINKSLGQSNESYHLKIKKSSGQIYVDGILDEEAWKVADVADNFHRVLPIDTGYAASKSEVFLTYSEDKIFIGIICYDELPGADIVESLRRDFSFGANSNFLVFIDPFDGRVLDD